MANRKSKSNIIASMSPEFSRNVADDIVEFCKATKAHPRFDPWQEIIHPDRIASSRTVEAYSTADVRQYILDRLDLLEGGNAAEGNPLLSSEDMVCAPAAIALLSRHFIITRENGITRYQVLDAANRIVVRVEGADNVFIPQVSQAIKNDLHAQGIAASKRLSQRLWDLYESNAPVAPKVKLWAQPDEDGYCLGRALVKPDASVPWDHLFEFVARLNDPEAFGAWVWGVYSGQYRGRQALYISDTVGESGKSSAFRAIERLFNLTQDESGNFVESNSPRVTASLNWNILSNSTHASAAFMGKKFVWVGDNKNPKILMSQAVKELSGDDMSMVNPKGLPAFSCYLDAKLAVLSNMEPVITSERHNQSRTLWLKLAALNIPPEQVSSDWAKHYDAEMPGFLAWAKEAYEDRCTANTKIRVNSAVLAATELKATEYEDMYSLPFAEGFVIDPDGRLDAAQLAGWFDYKKWDENRRSRFLEWMERTYEFKKVKGGRAAWFFIGVRLTNGASENIMGETPRPVTVPGRGFAMTDYRGAMGRL